MFLRTVSQNQCVENKERISNFNSNSLSAIGILKQCKIDGHLPTAKSTFNDILYGRSRLLNIFHSILRANTTSKNADLI